MADHDLNELMKQQLEEMRTTNRPLKQLAQKSNFIERHLNSLAHLDEKTKRNIDGIERDLLTNQRRTESELDADQAYFMLQVRSAIKRGELTEEQSMIAKEGLIELDRIIK